MGIFVEVNLPKLQSWLRERKLSNFCICFAHPPSNSKKKIMLRFNKTNFLTLHEIEEEIGEPIFTITVSNPKT